MATRSENDPSVPTAPPRTRRGVIGVLRRGEEMLMVRRAATVAKGGCWCFPGGHVERGETPRAAIVREFREELDLAVTAKRRLGSVRVVDSGYALAVWEVEGSVQPVRPCAAEIADWRWVSPEAALRLSPSLPSNQSVLEMLTARGS